MSNFSEIQDMKANVICTQGERVTLEYATLDDKKLVYEMLVSAEVRDFMFDEQHPAPTWEEFAEEPDNLYTGSPTDEGSYLLIKVDGVMIGSICYAFGEGRLRPAEMDIWIGSTAYLGQGYGTEAIQLLIDFVHSHYGTKTFLIRPWVKNQQAIRAYEKCGFAEVEDFDPSDYYSEESATRYGDGDYGVEETINLVYQIS